MREEYQGTGNGFVRLFVLSSGGNSAALHQIMVLCLSLKKS